MRASQQRLADVKCARDASLGKEGSKDGSDLSKHLLTAEFARLAARFSSETSCDCLQERKFRKRMDADGEVGDVRDARLSEFLDASLRSQQAVRRAMRGAATALQV